MISAHKKEVSENRRKDSGDWQNVKIIPMPSLAPSPIKAPGDTILEAVNEDEDEDDEKRDFGVKEFDMKVVKTNDTISKGNLVKQVSQEKAGNASNNFEQDAECSIDRQFKEIVCSDLLNEEVNSKSGKESVSDQGDKKILYISMLNDTMEIDG